MTSRSPQWDEIWSVHEIKARQSGFQKKMNIDGGWIGLRRNLCTRLLRYRESQNEAFNNWTAPAPHVA